MNLPRLNTLTTGATVISAVEQRLTLICLIKLQVSPREQKRDPPPSKKKSHLFDYVQNLTHLWRRHCPVLQRAAERLLFLVLTRSHAKTHAHTLKKYPSQTSEKNKTETSRAATLSRMRGAIKADETKNNTGPAGVISH